jgi:hypothetical protein
MQYRGTFLSLLANLFIRTCLLLFCSLSLANTVVTGPSLVKIVKNDQGFAVTVNGQPFVVKGAGLGYKNFESASALKSAGATAFRTWNMEHIEQELAIAANLDLMVAVGIATGKQLQGFDYDDKTAVAKQFEQVKAAIDKYKNHPNILFWVIANEPNLVFDPQGNSMDANPKVYDALADITDYIHQYDTNHPVTFALAGAQKKLIELVLKRVPQIDIISVQLYGDLANLGDYIAAANVDKPYLVTEFGPMGHWELPMTSWGREIEEPSGIKAKGLAQRMESSIVNDTSGKVIGSFAFYWGQKQERTPTWYGMYNESGEATARIDELSRIWSGHYPQNRAPLATAISLNELQATDNVKLKPSQLVTAKVMVTDPDNDLLTSQWALLHEVEVRSQGGHFEAKPERLDLHLVSSKIQPGFVEMSFITPATPGEYRLFNYTYDGHQHVGNANIPFLIEN